MNYELIPIVHFIRLWRIACRAGLSRWLVTPARRVGLSRRSLDEGGNAVKTEILMKAGLAVP